MASKREKIERLDTNSSEGGRIGSVIQSSGKVLGNLSKKGKKLSSKAAETASKGLQSATKAAQRTQYDLRKAHYNPIFWSDFRDPGFDLPNMIVIVDGDERKGIDVCEGAIGWLSKEAGVEVLHLYQEAVPEAGLNFFPAANCYAVYYLDALDRSRFIDLSSYYEVVQKDKLTELRNIAHSLGAKECRLESYEVEKEIEWKKGKGGAKVSPKGSIVESIEVSAGARSDKESSRERSIVFSQVFEGNDSPTRPTLRWYQNDMELRSLIEMRCDNRAQNALKEYSVTIDCSTSATMAVKMAAKIDAALKKLGAVCNFSMEGESRAESRRRLVFSIVF